MAKTVKGYEFALEINTASTGQAVYKKICLSSFDMNFNEVLVEWATICDKGFSQSEVVGMKPELGCTFTNLKEEAEGIQFLYGKQWSIEERNDVEFRFTEPALNKHIKFVATLTGMTYSMEAQGIQEVSCTLSFKGEPTIEEITQLASKTK